MPCRTKEEQKIYAAKHYQNNKGLYKERDRKRKKEMREWYARLKMKCQCETCGEDHPGCLTWHHEDPSQKEETVATMVSNRATKKKILEEIAKCQCLCANCHFKLHWEENSEYQKLLKEKIDAA